MILIFAILLLIFFGFLFTLLFFKNIHIIERIAYSFMFGMGLLTLLVFGASYLHFKMTAFNSIALLIFGVVVLAIVAKLYNKGLNRKDFNIFLGFSRLTNFEKIILILLAMLFVYSLLLATYWPVNVWDALALYDFRGKIIADTGDIFGTLRQQDYFAAYPPLTSIIHALVYLMGGKNPQFIYPIIYFCMVVIFYFRLSTITRRDTSLLMTFMTALTPAIFIHSTIAYTNLLYIAYFFISTLYIYLFAKERKITYLMLSAFAGGLSTWTRSFEPFWISNIIFLFVLFFLNRDFKKIKLYLVYPIVFFPIQQLWISFLEKVLEKPYSAIGVVRNSYLLFRVDLNQAIEVFRYLYENVILSWGLVLILFILVVIKDFRFLKRKENLFLIILIFINISVLVGGMYFFSLANSTWRDIADSAKRMSMVFIPLFAFYIGISNTAKHFFRRS